MLADIVDICHGFAARWPYWPASYIRKIKDKTIVALIHADKLALLFTVFIPSIAIGAQQ